jgi:hypothetical protein
MRHFKLLESGIDVAPILRELADHPELWGQNTGRQNSVDVQRETQAVAICSHTDQRTFLEARQQSPVSYVGRPTPTAQLLPNALEFVQRQLRQLHGRSGRAVIVRLKPHGHVYEHIDGGLYYDLRYRCHLILHSVAGSRLRAGNEEVRMREGEFWWFDNQQPHDAVNESDEDRIHLIMDVLSFKSVASLPGRVLRDPRLYIDRLRQRRRRLKGQ